MDIFNRIIINTESRKEARRKFNGSEKWVNYAERIQKHPFVKNYLMKKYGGICQYCGMPIRNNLQLQHKYYSKECVSEKTIYASHPTPARPDGVRRVPDCGRCVRFHECVDDSLYPVHAGCNAKIARIPVNVRKKEMQQK